MAYDASLVLNELKEMLQLRLSSVTFSSWFQELEPICIEGDSLLIAESPSPLAKSIIDGRYKEDIRQCFEELGYPLSLRVYDTGTYTPQVAKELEQEEKLNDLARQAGLNPRYTFENFIKGNNNNLAFASALAVAEMPGKTFNPLYIWGSPGLGKTHLMQSIAHHVLTTDPSKKVLYVTSETFLTDLINSIATNTTSDFRRKYRQIDVLLIDDIQFFSGRESIQLELFHTFNALYENGKQIVISSDRTPRELETLEERIRSRLFSGMTADIKPPDYETRVAILQKKAEMNHIDADISVLGYIANNVSSNIRELEGALTTVAFFARLYPDQKIDIEMAQEALKDYTGVEGFNIIDLKKISDIVCQRYHITIEDIKSKKKPKEIAYPRQIAMFLARKLTEESLSEIGSFYGGRDHTTVIHAINKVQDELSGPEGEELRRALEDMERRINGE